MFTHCTILCKHSNFYKVPFFFFIPGKPESCVILHRNCHHSKYIVSNVRAHRDGESVRTNSKETSNTAEVCRSTVGAHSYEPTVSCHQHFLPLRFTAMSGYYRNQSQRFR